MTISSTSNRVVYTGNGTTTVFTVPFLFLNNADLKVFVNDALQILNLSYTVSGAGVQSGGTLTFVLPPTSGVSVVILRDPPITQLTDYIENDDFPAESHERALDKLTIISQRISERADRAFTLPDSYTGSASTVLPQPQASTFIGWNSTGTALTNTSTTGLLTLAASTGFVSQTFSGTGAQVNFTLSSPPETTANLEVFVAGARLRPTLDYTVSGVTLTFVAAPAAGTNNILVRFVQILPAGVVADLSVTNAKLASDAVTNDKIANNTITGAKLAAYSIKASRWSLDSGPFMFRNRLINGDMRISQRGSAFTSAGGGNNSGAYVLDRWRIASDGNDVVDVTTATETIDGVSYPVMALDVETINKKFGVYQIIEASNCSDMVNNKFVTLTFKARVSSTTKLNNIKAAVIGWAGSVDSVAATIVTAWNATNINPTLNTSLAYESPPINMDVTTTWASYSVTGFVDAANTKNLIVFIWSDVEDTTLGDFLYLTDVQLDVGDGGTPFEKRPIGIEWVLCQRYYEAIVVPTTREIATLQATSTTAAEGGFTPFKVYKRANPSVSVTGTLQTTVANGGSAGGTVAAAGIWQDGMTWDVTSATGLVAGNATLLVANGSVLIKADAEL